MIYLKILFIGCVQSSEILLQKLIEMNEDIVGVITKSKSNYNSDFRDLSELCTQHGIDYIYTEDANSEDTIKYIKLKEPDIIYCFGWSQLLGDDMIDIPKRGIIGFHPADLPNNRGRHPIIWALALGLKYTASSYFFIDKDADTGDIISKKNVKIEYKDDAQSLYNKIMETAVVQLETMTKQLKNNSYSITKQNADEGNSWRKRSANDGKIDWRMSSYSIYNLVRAITKPYIGAHFIYENKEYKVWKVEEVKISNFENIEPGKILEVYSNQSFLVKVGDFCIKVLECDEIFLEKGKYL